MDKQEKEVLNKRTTIHDVAHEAGVSMTTVSHALNGYKDVNEQTRQKIVEIAIVFFCIPLSERPASSGI